MRMIKQLFPLSISSILIVGCATPPSPEVPPSKAYVLASQSYLTKDTHVLWATHESPLRDYSLADVEYIEESYKNSPGNASVIFGVMSLMTGNFTGMIDIAGGTAANIAKTPHVAKQSSWVVRIPVDDATDGMEAWRIAVDTIQENTLKLLATKGVTPSKIILNEQRLATFGATIWQDTVYRVDPDDESSGFLYENEMYRNNGKYGLVIDESYLINGKPTYSNSYETMLSGVYAYNGTYFKDKKIHPYDQKDGFALFMKDLTAMMPEHYFYYDAPSANNFYIPTIYQNGAQYRFLNPNEEQQIMTRFKARLLY